MSAGTPRHLAILALLAGLLLLSVDVAAPGLGAAHPLALTARAGLAASCHQQPERSFRRGGEALPVCARCTGLHASAALGGALLLVLPAAAARRLPRPRLLVALGLGPLAVDVALGILVGGWDHPWLRAATGLWAGTALLLTLLSRAKEGRTA